MIYKTVLVLMLLVTIAGGGYYVYLNQIEQQNIEKVDQLIERTQKVSSILS